MNIRDYKYAECRGNSHAWERYQPLRGSQMGIVISWRCTRCPRSKDEVISRATGEIVTRHYSRDDGYETDGIVADKNDFRKEFARREMAKQKARKR